MVVQNVNNFERRILIFCTLRTNKSMTRVQMDNGVCGRMCVTYPSADHARSLTSAKRTKPKAPARARCRRIDFSAAWLVSMRSWVRRSFDPRTQDMPAGWKMPVGKANASRGRNKRSSDCNVLVGSLGIGNGATNCPTRSRSTRCLRRALENKLAKNRNP